MNPGSTSIANAMTVDVEDYFQVSAFEHVVDRGRWQSFESRVVRNTQRILDVFDAHGLMATFFVLGWIAEREPALIAQIAQRGHEVACHGYSHQLVYRQERSTFAEETARSKRVLEDIVQQPVLGYRAASYSITGQSLWALDVLAELGFNYDSSIFPVRHDRYGIPGAPEHIHRVDLAGGASLIEFPLSSYRLLGNNIPVAGGGYFRFYPYWLTRWFLRQLEATGAPFIFYLHPWEIDPAQPRIPGAGALSRFRHYLNLHRCEARLRQLITDFSFGTVQQALTATHGGDPSRLPVCSYAT